MGVPKHTVEAQGCHYGLKVHSAALHEHILMHQNILMHNGVCVAHGLPHSKGLKFYQFVKALQMNTRS